MSAGVSADAEWQQRQTAGYSPALGSEQGRRHSRPLTEHVLWECLSAGIRSAPGQIPLHIQAALVANLVLINTSLLTQ